MCANVSRGVGGCGGVESIPTTDFNRGLLYRACFICLADYSVCEKKKRSVTYNLTSPSVLLQAARFVLVSYCTQCAVISVCSMVGGGGGRRKN